ncbi:MAG: hypothetical protein A2365_01470 [Candidatus Nealsonbacteria bacterium RIFOXYB1_FULL_40_15]|uniref:Uncharacterized protein n=2 Tax=Candidatus Nealsoniibacteriota TaxID=1817911 RepID=A0A1G2ENJ8_9BACT|nr:MAG: hypothetical protein A2427_00010 [Candidatus Nealsonbacteria bacterium RIFOXYC1_FULL_40_7]OGZ27244.1 MAG: hypothetical protein A2365_01470 [Candidatus Nealsonbacteria bacterium RIFOXYB1_FULL_40_15]
MKNKKILVGIVILIAVAAIFLFLKKNSIPGEENRPAENISWNDLLPQAEEVIKQKFGGENLRQIGIYEEGDITGDGIPEALVYTGLGGAYTDQLVLMIMENQKPAFAKFKEKNGNISGLVFLSGSSVRHGELVEMIPEDKAVYSASWSMSESGEMEECLVDVYLWNGYLFEYSDVLSGGSEQALCKELY